MKLYGVNYVNWNFKIQTLVVEYNVWSIESHDEVKLEAVPKLIATLIQDCEK